MQYVHFTDLSGASAMVKTHKLLESTFGATGVFAVAVGGAYVPSVQRTSGGRAKDRRVAVLFETSVLPDTAYPEEVIWHLPSIPIDIISIMLADKAARLLDNSLDIDDETSMLKIPLHPSANNADSGTVRFPKGLKPWVPGEDNEKLFAVNKVFRSTGQLSAALRILKSIND